MRVRYKRATAILQVLIVDEFESEEHDKLTVDKAYERWQENQPTVNGSRTDTGITRLTLLEEDK